MSSENALTEFAVWTTTYGDVQLRLASLTTSQIVPGADAQRGSPRPEAAATASAIAAASAWSSTSVRPSRTTRTSRDRGQAARDEPLRSSSPRTHRLAVDDERDGRLAAGAASAAATSPAARRAHPDRSRSGSGRCRGADVPRSQADRPRTASRSVGSTMRAIDSCGTQRTTAAARSAAASRASRPRAVRRPRRRRSGPPVRRIRLERRRVEPERRLDAAARGLGNQPIPTAAMSAAPSAVASGSARRSIAPARDVGLDLEPRPVARRRHRRPGSCRRRGPMVVEPLDDVPDRVATALEDGAGEVPPVVADRRARRTRRGHRGFQRGVMAPPRAGRKPTPSAPAGASPASRPISAGARRGCPRRAIGRCPRRRSRDARPAIGPPARARASRRAPRDRGSGWRPPLRRVRPCPTMSPIRPGSRIPAATQAACSSPVPTTTGHAGRPHACATSSRSGPAMSVAGRSSPRVGRIERQRHAATHPDQASRSTSSRSRHEAFAGSTTRRPVRQATIQEAGSR